jgi:hypothetical protein
LKEVDMGKGKKTVKVGSILEQVNYCLQSDNFSEEQKDAMSGLLETILHDTDNYEGFYEIEPEKSRYSRKYGVSNAVRSDYVDGLFERKENGGLRVS